MIKIGIVGKKHCKSFISIIDNINSYEFVGVFDPCFQFETPKDFNSKLIYLSFENLVKQSEAIIFATHENIYLPLIELAIKYSRSVFLQTVHNLSYQEQCNLLKLCEEARGTLQINQPIIFNDSFKEFLNLSKNPLLLNYNYSDCTEKKLLIKTRHAVSAINSVFKSNLKKITTNVISACAEIPDIIKIRLDFDNGSVAEIMINSVEKEIAHKIQCFEYNSYYKFDLINNKLVGQQKNQAININSALSNNTSQKNLEKQLIDFYFNIINCKSPINSIENEIITQQVIEKVKEKLRICINIL